MFGGPRGVWGAPCWDVVQLPALPRGDRGRPSLEIETQTKKKNQLVFETVVKPFWDGET